MESLNQFFATLSGYVWGTPLLVLLGGTGILLTFRLRGIQIHKLPYALGLIFKKGDENEQGDVSHFQALMIALAATIGTGNIVGVASAVGIGGPGALFWMWLIAFFGMATKYAEGILAVKYRIVDENGEMSGGPMYYIERGLGLKWLGVMFALFGAIAGFGLGNMVQANAVAENLYKAFGTPEVVTGVVLAALTAAVILGGVKRVGLAAGWIVPMMAIAYMCGAVVILIRFYDQIPMAFGMIFDGAFGGTAAAGGFSGAALKVVIQKGISRGIFSNESGLGSAPIAAAAAKTKNPVEQALVSMTGTFIDTIVVCTMTGLVLIVTGVWKSGGSVGVLTRDAFEIGLPGGGGMIVSIGIIFFSYSTLLGWSYYGEKCIEYLFGARSILAYRWAWIIAIAVGASIKLDLVWNFSDVMNGLMAIPNLIALIGLSGVVVEETNKYLDQAKKKTTSRPVALAK